MTITLGMAGILTLGVLVGTLTGFAMAIGFCLVDAWRYQRKCYGKTWPKEND